MAKSHILSESLWHPKSSHAGSQPSYPMSSLGDGTSHDTNVFTFIVLACAMQAGFGLRLIAATRSSSEATRAVHGLLMAFAAGILGWYLCGYAFSFGNDAGHFLGNDHFFLTGIGTPFKSEFHARAMAFFVNAVRATTAVAVAASALRANGPLLYMLTSLFLSMIVFPFATHWVWNVDGWASPANLDEMLINSGAVDFAGAGVIHVVGGATAFVAAWMRPARLDAPEGSDSDKGERGEAPSGAGGDVATIASGPLTVIGTLLLWFAWFGLNASAAPGLPSHPDSVAVAEIGVATALSAAAGALTSLATAALWGCWFSDEWSETTQASRTCNGALAGLVSISASCAVVRPWAAIAIGCIGGFVYFWAAKFASIVMAIDDPLDVAAVHGVCGVWGLLAVGFFADRAMLADIYAKRPPESFGVAMGSNNASLLIAQLLFALALVGWAAGTAAILFAFVRLVVRAVQGDGERNEKRAGRTSETSLRP